MVTKIGATAFEKAGHGIVETDRILLPPSGGTAGKVAQSGAGWSAIVTRAGSSGL